MTKASGGLKEIIDRMTGIRDLLPEDNSDDPPVNKIDIKSGEKWKLFGKRYIHATFENYKAQTEGQRKALQTAQKIAQRIKENPEDAGMIVAFIGKSGTGKDHLAASIFDYVYTPEIRVKHTTVAKMSRAIRESKRQQEVLDYYSSNDWLIINEIGVQKVSDFERQFLHEVVDAIYREQGSCLLISNEDDRTFEHCIDFDGKTRVRDRLENRIVVFDWESYR